MSLFSKLLTETLSLLHVPAPLAVILEPVLESSVKTLLSDATTAALPIVKDLEKGSLPSADKRKTAVAQVTDALKAQGKAVSGNVTNLAVELALQHVRSLV